MNPLMPAEGPMPMMFSTKRFLMTTTLALAVGFAMAMPAAAQDAVTKGQGVYTAQKCQMCHAIAGKGNKSNPLDGVGGKTVGGRHQTVDHPPDGCRGEGQVDQEAADAEQVRQPAGR